PPARPSALDRVGPPTSHAGVGVRLDGEADGRALLLVQFELHERRYRAQTETIGLDVRPCDGDGLDGLVDGVRSDGLDFYLALVAQQSRDRASYRVRPRRSRYPKNLYLGPPKTVRVVIVCSIVSPDDKASLLRKTPSGRWRRLLTLSATVHILRRNDRRRAQPCCVDQPDSRLSGSCRLTRVSVLRPIPRRDNGGVLLLFELEATVDEGTWEAG